MHDGHSSVRRRIRRAQVPIGAARESNYYTIVIILGFINPVRRGLPRSRRGLGQLAGGVRTLGIVCAEGSAMPLKMGNPNPKAAGHRAKRAEDCTAPRPS